MNGASGGTLWRGWLRLTPGLALAVAVCACAMWASAILGESLLGYQRSPISPVMVAMLLGLLIRNVFRLPAWIQPGLDFSVKRILRVGIILMGIRLSVLDVFQLGTMGIPVIVACIAGALAAVTFLAWRMRVPKSLGTLIAVGTSICGVSAIMATAPAIEAEEETVAYAIAVVTVFGVLATLVYPYLGEFLFGGNGNAVGVFLGTSVHDTSQVAGAAMVYAQTYAAPQVADIAVVTKLVRNVFLVLVIPCSVALHARTAGARWAGRRTAWRQLLPLFVIGFVALSMLRTVGDAGQSRAGMAFGVLEGETWEHIVAGVSRWAGYLLVVALAGVGLKTEFRNLSRLGLRPFAVGLSAAALVGAISYAMIVILNKVAGWGLGVVP